MKGMILQTLTTNNIFFSNNYIVDVFLFITAVISLLAIYLLCKHKKLRTLIASLALQQVKEVGAVTIQEEVTTECKIQSYIILTLTVTILRSSDVCSSTLKKIKAVQGTHVL